MNSMFAKCISLEEINISHFKTSSLTDMSKMFYNCQKLRTINLSNLKILPNNLKGMFENCHNLKIIEGLSKLNTSEVTDMSEMFSFCNSLSEIDLLNFNTSSVKNMSFMFYGVLSEIIDVTNFKTSLVEDMSFMFAKELHDGFPEKEQKIIGLTNFDTSKVNSMKSMFVLSKGLSSLDLSRFTVFQRN